MILFIPEILVVVELMAAEENIDGFLAQELAPAAG